MFVIPVQFSKDHKEMLAHCREMIEYQNGQVAINPRFTKLINALRTAVKVMVLWIRSQLRTTTFIDAFRLPLDSGTEMIKTLNQ
jgi:hypothetical protein